MIKKIKFYSLVTLGVVTSILCYKLNKDTSKKEMHMTEICIKDINSLKNYKKIIDSSNNNIYYNNYEKYEEIKTPIIIGFSLKKNEKVYYHYVKKISK